MEAGFRLIVLSACFLFGLARAQAFATTTESPCASQSPCVALVLGGGGARGGAHIGVLKALEQYGIPVHLVVGTSIGSFVGGLHATGKTADEIEALFARADWNDGYRDALSRQVIPVRRKHQLDAYPIHLDLGISGDGIKIPQGLIQGQAMKQLVDSMLGHYPEFPSFNNLPIPYRAVAANAETGEAVVLSEGDLATAMQASMSLPGIVRPIEINGNLLVDGGIANNIPVSVAKNLGADIVIAVDLGVAQRGKKAKLNSSFAILSQLTNFLTETNIEHQRSLLRPPDLLLEPEIEGVGLLSFDKTHIAMEAGYREAINKLRVHTTLMQLAEQKSAPQIALPEKTKTLKIAHIALNNDSRLADDFVLKRMNIEAGGRYTQQDIHRGVNRLYGLSTFSRVATSVIEEENGSALVLDVQEKEWGPGYLDFKLAFEDDFNSFSQYQVGLAYRRTNLSKYGAEWFTAFEFGTAKKIYSDFNWPIKKSPFFWRISGEYKREVEDYRYQNDSYGNVSTDEITAATGFGWNAIDRLEVFVGALRRQGSTEIPAILQPVLAQKKLSGKKTGAQITINYDSLDHAYFPKHGWKLSADLHRTRDDVLNISEYSSQIDSEWNGVASIDRHSLRALARYQSTLSEEDYALLGIFHLGGFLNLSGHSKDSILGQHVRFFSLVYNYELAQNNFGAIRLPLYLGFSAEAGNAWDTQSDVDYSQLIHSGSVFVGWDSPIGAAYLAYGRSETDDVAVYIFLGGVF